MDHGAEVADGGRVEVAADGGQAHGALGLGKNNKILIQSFRESIEGKIAGYIRVNKGQKHWVANLAIQRAHSVAQLH